MKRERITKRAGRRRGSGRGVAGLWLAVVAAAGLGLVVLTAGPAQAESGCHKNPPPKSSEIGSIARAD